LKFGKKNSNTNKEMKKMFLKFVIKFFVFVFFKKLAIALEGYDFFEIFCLCHQENFEKKTFLK
jgi:hypothetical protein